VADVVYTGAVEGDLTDIGDMIAADDPGAAVAFIDAIRQHCSLLAVAPLMGRSRPDIGPSVHSFPHRSYIVFYRYRAEIDQAQILRVWHGRRRHPSLADLGIEGGSGND
jgi:toxin ParE1/3/4